MTDYFIYSGLDSGLVLDVKHAVGKPGTHVQVFSKNYGSNQLWTLAESHGFTKIKSLLEDTTSSATDLVIDISGGAAVSHAAVEVNAGSSAASQLWTFSPVPGAASSIASSLASTMVLDIEGGHDKSGSTVQIYADHSGENQVWFLSPLYKASLSGASGQHVVSVSSILATNDSFSLTNTGAGAWTSLKLAIVNPMGGFPPYFAGDYKGPGTATRSASNADLEIGGLTVNTGQKLNFSTDIIAGEGGWSMTATPNG